MAKIYLQPGQRIIVEGPVYVGVTGTIVDSKLDWDGTTLHNICKDDVYDRNKLVGTYTDWNTMKSWYVFLEEHTGRFWLDDEEWM